MNIVSKVLEIRGSEIVNPWIQSMKIVENHCMKMSWIKKSP